MQISVSLSLPFFPINPCPRSNRIVRDREGGAFFAFLSRRGSFYSSRHPKKNPASGGILFSPSRGGGKKERKIVVISLMKIENGEGEGRLRGEYRREDFIRKIKKMMDVGAAQRQRGPIVEGRSRCAPIRRPGSTHVPCANRVIMYSRSAPWPVVGVKRGGPLGYTYSNRC